MKVNLGRIRAHVQQSRADRGGVADRRETTGSSRLIRENLTEILRLHDKDGMKWSEIAAALGEQGIVEGPDKRPISKSRLTALVSQLKRQQQRNDDHAASRRQRTDLPHAVVTPADRPAKRYALSPDLDRRDAPALPSDLPNEADLLRQAFDKNSLFLKKDSQ